MHLKLAAIVAGIVVLILAPYFLWHESMDACFESPEFAPWIISAKPCAWAIAIRNMDARRRVTMLKQRLQDAGDEPILPGYNGDSDRGNVT